MILLSLLLILPALATESAEQILDSASFWSRKDWKEPKELLVVLASSPMGRDLWAKSVKKNVSLEKEIKKGQASFTESSFVRSYSLLDGREAFTQKNKIYLNSNLSLAEAALDLAHELIHFNEKSLLNPYQDSFSVDVFIKDGIEGQGGELAALEQECAISWELEKKYKTFPAHKICSRYRDKQGAFLREEALSDYYSIGSWHFPEEVAQNLPALNRRKISLSSSYAKKPYPLALYHDYIDTRKSACANNQKKYELISAQVEGGRNPASASALERERKRLKLYREKNCARLKANEL